MINLSRVRHLLSIKNWKCQSNYFFENLWSCLENYYIRLIKNLRGFEFGYKIFVWSVKKPSNRS